MNPGAEEPDLGNRVFRRTLYFPILRSAFLLRLVLGLRTGSNTGGPRFVRIAVETLSTGELEEILEDV